MSLCVCSQSVKDFQLKRGYYKKLSSGMDGRRRQKAKSRTEKKNYYYYL